MAEAMTMAEVGEPVSLEGAIDCDVHPQVPGIRTLVPYLDDYWREMVEVRGIDGFESRSYPPLSPLSARPDWRGRNGRAAESVEPVKSQLFDRWRLGNAILNCLYGVQLIMDEHLAAAMAKAVNDWIAREWLDAEPRLSASIVVPVQNPELAVEEIERRAADRRFVQVLMLVMGDMPLGRRFYWPIYAAAERHGLPIAVHTGSAYRQAVTAIGWPSTYAEDYCHQAQAFQGQTGSLISHGVFNKYPGLKVVLSESGITWLPPFAWRFSKNWRGLRMEIPWVERAPIELIREHFRLTLQPIDAPDEADAVLKLIEHLGSDDVLLYSSDYPHWQFDGDQSVPDGLPAALRRKILVDNPLATYPRLGGRP
jgi:predicted TIM-barrel fold metal-dependent hydrolase